MNAIELKVILDQHKLWIESSYQKGKPANLQYVNLEDANLQGADLQGANLYGAFLQDADLQDANLQDVHLHNANLVYANLYGANLGGADLKGANLGGADLAGAKFTTNFKSVGYFAYATFSEDQVAWVCLHPKFHKWASTLKWVKAERLSA